MSLTSDQQQALRQFRPVPLVRNSERYNFKTCPAQWNWRWNMGLVPAMQRQDSRWFGSGLHLALAEWYTPPKAKNGFVRGRDPRETWSEFAKDAYNSICTSDYWDDNSDKEWTDANELGHIMLTAYLGHYGTDDAWEVLMPETRFRAKIPFNPKQAKKALLHWVELGYPRGAIDPIAEIVGTFDMPIRNHQHSNPKVEIVAHKSTSRQEQFKSLQKDDQGGTYISVSTTFLRKAGMIASTESVTGMIFNYLRKAKPDGRPTDAQGRCLNNDGSVSKKQPAPLFWRDYIERNAHNRLRQLERIADDVEVMQSMRLGVLPILKSPGQHCNWCDFNDLCDVDEDGGDVAQYIKDVYIVEDPYADHYEGAVNSKESVASQRETGVT